MFCAAGRTTQRQQAWLRSVIFIGLYLVLMMSFAQCALVLYLYGTGQVDELMTPSLIIALIASFLSVPFVVIHTILSWQYHKVPRLNIPRNALHLACSHLPRIMIASWLAASVAGLVILSKQALCLPTTEAQGYWKAGIACEVHRVTVILSILAFLTTSALFFCFQVCERPYDASLLGLYSPQHPPRDGSIFSESSWESETLKNEIFYLCRHPDAGPGNGELYWSPTNSSLFETPVRPPSIRYPGPTRVRPQLHLNTHTNSIRPSIVGTNATDTSPKVSPIDETARAISLQGDVSPLSRNPSTTSTLQLGTEAAITRPPIPKVPQIPETPIPIPPNLQQQQQQNGHQEQIPSDSSQKFLPEGLDLSRPLSEDPQIRALASPPLSPKSETMLSAGQSEKGEESNMGQSLTVLFPAESALTPAVDSTSTPPSHSIRTRRRSMTAPGNPPPVLPPVPLVVRKSQSSHLNPLPHSIHHPHHPNYVPRYPTPKSCVEGLKSSRIPNDNIKQLQRHNSTVTHAPSHRQPNVGGAQGLSQGQGHPRFSPSQTSLASHGSMMTRNHSQKQRFHTSSSFPRNTQFSRAAPPHSQRQQYQQQHTQPRLHPHLHHPPQPSPPPSARPPYMRRFHSNDGRGFDPSRTLPPIPRSDETATIYPSTRRPRSSTYGGLPSSGEELRCKNSSNTNSNAPQGCREPETSTSQEKQQCKRTSLSLVEGGLALDADRETVNRNSTYRGAERTSIGAASAGTGAGAGSSSM